jgi:hypothetical protein
MLDDVDDLAFGDAADLIELKAAFALDVFGWFSGAKESVGNHRYGCDGGNAHPERYFQIGEYEKQRRLLRLTESSRTFSMAKAVRALHSGLTSQRDSTVRIPSHLDILPEGEAGGSYACAACTGLRNMPIPVTETSTVSFATSGPTPAGVPVEMTSPGSRVIMREIQRTRKAQG